MKATFAIRRATLFTLVLSLAGAWRGALAAGAAKRVGFLVPNKARDYVERIAAFKEGMRALGYVEGRDFAFDLRAAEERYEQLPALAKELVALKPDVVLGVASQAISALRDATATIPIISVTTGDPVSAGFAKSLARPGGNITGLANLNVDIDAKLLSLLVQVSPRASPVALLYNPASSSAASHRKYTQAAVRAAGAEWVELGASSVAEVEKAFETMKANRVAVLIVAADAFLTTQAALIANLALKAQLPAASQNDAFPRAGLLMSYGAALADNYRQAARYVDRILKGAKPAELPFEQPTDFELVINRRTARALKVSIPGELALSAQRIID